MHPEIKRFNIYSCLTLTLGNKEICFDPAKIRKEDLDTINPDLIFISHESMDHMNPTQVYFLHKKKQCKIFCSIAAAVDLIQFFPLDIDFVDSIHVLVPGCQILYDGIEVTTVLSLHCDYMLPLVFRLDFLKEGFSCLHCFDTHLSEEVKAHSVSTDLAIIPIGIAKGVSEVTGFEFAAQLKSRYFVTNHFKDEADLVNFHRLIEKRADKERFFLVDWNKSCRLSIPRSFDTYLDREQHEERRQAAFSTLCQQIVHNKEVNGEQLKQFLTYVYIKRCSLLEDKHLIINLLDSYSRLTEEGKKHVLMIATVLSLLNHELIAETFITDIKGDVFAQCAEGIHNIKVRALFFLGIHSQQKNSNYFLEQIYHHFFGHSFDDHTNYWFVEFFGRCATSKGRDSSVAIDALVHICALPHLYESVVVRRKLFWEFHRIMKYIPQVSNRFFKVFEEGLEDSNPDVRLLALLCLGLANRIYYLTSLQIYKILSLLEDPEDDVRETALRVIGVLSKNHKNVIKQNMSQISRLLADKNCHVQFAAKETCELVNII